MDHRSEKEYFRVPWENFPDCIIHADENEVRSHSSYHAAKTGDSDAALELVHTFLNDHRGAEIQELPLGR